ncbi:MAG: transporter substrate-binding protein [Actinomycetia bacterium]|nr:transporter substrate-binding protein [Actinomycetes bacterium]
MHHKFRSLALVLVLALGFGGAMAATAATAGAKTAATDLSGVCPSKLVLQTDWFPEAEYGVYYSMIGDKGTLDAKKGTYTGPLLNTGIDLEIRAGGPFIGQETVQSLMYQDNSINLGLVHTDDAVRFSKTLPVVAVAAPLEHSPLALVWDTSKHHFKSFKDIGASGATILVFTKAVNYVPFLVKKGLVPDSSFDDSFDGSYTRFVADPSIVQQAFVTETPYRLKNEITKYGKQVGSIMVSASGYDPYLSSLSVKKSDLKSMSPCLKKLVPIVQQAQVDYITKPAAGNKTMVDVATGMKTFWTLSPKLLAFGNAQMLKHKIVDNGGDATLGNMTTARVQKVIGQFHQVFGTNVDTANSSVKPSDISTNQFIDSKIGL